MNEYLNKRKRYYQTKAVQFELLKAMKDREVVFMDRKDGWKCIRGNSFRSIDYLNKSFEAFKFFERDYNIYISVARYTDIPTFTYDLTKRSTETKFWFETVAEKNQYDYNILLDFDNRYRVNTNKVEEYRTGGEVYKTKKHEWVINRLGMLNDIKKVLKLLDAPFYIIPSGTNYQIVINNEDKLTKKEVEEYIRNLKVRYNLQFLDLAGVGHAFKIMKCPYSLAGEIVCFPLRYISKRTLNDYNYFDCNNILKNEKLAYRGIPKIDTKAYVVNL